MKSGILSSFSRIALCAMAVAATLAASAQRASSPQDVNLTAPPPTLSEIGSGIAAVGQGVGLSVYSAVRHDSTVTGCALNAPDGLLIETEGDGQTYALVGEVAGIRPGQRIRISGRKPKPNPGVPRLFLVTKVKQESGSCKEIAAR
jgi:hypothetical protein